VRVQVVGVAGVPEIRAGDDLATVLAPPLRACGVRPGDVLALTQKVVSKAEGRVVPAADADWVAQETRRVVARRADLVIVETRHGLVCANAGVDASNVADGFVSLLPEDPDASAAGVAVGLGRLLGHPLPVVVTDTFGRPWREGVTNVAIGCAGLPSIVDLRGTTDDRGRELTATIVALGDEIAAASGLVMPKDGRIPAAIVRGVSVPGHAPPAVAAGADPPNGASLIRRPEDDMFREAPLQAIASRSAAARFGDGGVARDAIVEAIRAASPASASDPTARLTFVVAESSEARRRVCASLAAAATPDGRAGPDAIDVDPPEDPAASPRVALESAAVIVVPCAALADARADGIGAAIDAGSLRIGATMRALLLAIHAQALASRWLSPATFDAAALRGALAVDRRLWPLGAVAIGRPASGPSRVGIAPAVGGTVRFA
jgi:coenzyme F420-0:L-glutamate ligase / coenzyme F420-1:gamma-L-glutamate ligase